MNEWGLNLSYWLLYNWYGKVYLDK
jgi:hypothetical protein